MRERGEGREVAFKWKGQARLQGAMKNSSKIQRWGGIRSLSRGGPGSDLGYRRVSMSGTYPKLNFLLYCSVSFFFF